MTTTKNNDEEARLSTVIRLPQEKKAQLKILCTRHGIAMRDYVEQLVHAALALDTTPPGREAMAQAATAPHAQYEQVQHCKYGCNYHTKSKSGLAQHEATCTYQRSRNAQQRAKQVEANRDAQEPVIA